jgi:Sulfotransferase family
LVARTPIFVVGAPRSGTTLLKDVLNRHSDVHLFNEVHFFERIWDDRGRLGPLTSQSEMEHAVDVLHEMMSKHGTDGDVAASLTPSALQQKAVSNGGGYSGLLEALLTTASELHGARHWGDSSPQDVLYLSTLLAWYPNARVIAMVRDPRAFMASYKNYHRRAMASYKERYNPLTLSMLWRSYMSAAQNSQCEDYAERVMIQRYEELVADPPSSLKAICDHLRIDFQSSMLDVSGANSSYTPGEGEKGIFSSSTDRWRQELTATEQWLTERICGQTMKRLGYTLETGDRAFPPSLPEFAGIVSIVPSRLFNMLFRGRKEFRFKKLRRVISLLRSKESQ